MTELSRYKAKSGTFVPVWTLEIQTLPQDTDRILDEVQKVHPLSYGRYQRNASISAVGRETAQPEAGSTTTTHVAEYEADGVVEFMGNAGDETAERRHLLGDEQLLLRSGQFLVCDIQLMIGPLQFADRPADHDHPGRPPLLVAPDRTGERDRSRQAGAGDEPDILISDLVMPGMSGSELAQVLLERHPSMRVVLMSGYSDAALEDRDALALAHASLQKPFSTHDFVRTIREVLE